MIYAVIDTNVLVAALITHNLDSPTARVLDCVSCCRITPIYNNEILAEYSEVLHRPKFKIADNQITDILDFFIAYGIESSRVPYNVKMPDEKDRAFYEVSLSREDSFLVTGNLKHFPRTPQVVSPTEMMSIIDSGL